jgi:hypothetical protein
MSGRVLLLAAAGGAVLLAGCQSTQDRSAEIKRKGLKKLANQHGLVVSRQTPDVRILSTVTLHDSNGSAVVVRMRNLAPRPLVQPPIAVDVEDAAGKSIYRNDTPGLETSLVQAALLPARGELWWVDDQVQPSGTPARAKALVGNARQATGPVPRVDLREVHIFIDPVSGVGVKGQAFNRSRIEQPRLVIYCVARKHGRVVAAGRSIIERLRVDKPSRFTVFFIGDPRGAALTLAAPPTALSAKGAS